MSQLNQEAPPATASKSGEDYFRPAPFPKSDTIVLTVVAFNFNPKAEFDRTDDAGKDYTEVAPGIDFYFGAMVEGKPYFVKSWTQKYSLHEKSNYTKWYDAAVGKPPATGTNVADMLGKFILGEIKVEDKKSKKGTAYTVSKLASVTKVPSILASTGTPLDQLRPALDAILTAKDDSKPPF